MEKQSKYTEEENGIIQEWLVCGSKRRRDFLIWLNKIHKLKSIAEIIEIVEAKELIKKNA